MDLFVMRAGAIGDFILTLPALTALRKRFPAHRLILAARADVLPLVHFTLTDDVIAFDDERLTALFTRDSEPTNQLSNLFSDIDLAVLWLPDSSARIVADNLRRFNIARLIAANPLPTYRHAADHLLDTLVPLGISAHQLDAVPRLAPTQHSEYVANLWQRLGLTPSTRIIAMHVGSGDAHKRWPLDNYRALAARIVAIPNTQVLLLSGPAENISTLTLPAHATHIADCALSDLAALLARCQLYIGNDSGITHLAAALGMPTVALFGPTDPTIWGPRGAHVIILRSPTQRIDDVPVEQLWQAIQHVATAQDEGR